MEWNTSCNRVFYHFEQLSKIPHGSFNTKAISDYCVAFAKVLNLPVQQDSANNVIIRKPASAGYEELPVVMLQGHLDMVAVAEEGLDFDFKKDGLRLKRNGDWLTADGTSLGGDDGIAIAMAMAILEDDTLEHPALECVFTTDEEVGMLGAAALDMSDLKARYLLNMDCEDEGIITASCAGGVRVGIEIPAKQDTMDGCELDLRISGLQGGHSGMEISKNRVNGIRLLMETVEAVFSASDGEARIVSVSGGVADNAIPADGQAVLAIPEARKQAVEDALHSCVSHYAAEYPQEKDLNLQWDFGRVKSIRCWSLEANELPDRILSLPNGVQSMTTGMDDLVETSLNLGILRSSEKGCTLDFSLRSSIDEKKEELIHILEEAAKDWDADFETTGNYPGWPLILNSPLQQEACSVWKDLFHQELKVEAIHAGLECGLFANALPGIDIIAYGPQMHDIHSPREELSISSTERTYAFTLEMLKRMKNL